MSAVLRAPWTRGLPEVCSVISTVPGAFLAPSYSVNLTPTRLTPCWPGTSIPTSSRCPSRLQPEHLSLTRYGLQMCLGSEASCKKLCPHCTPCEYSVVVNSALEVSLRTPFPVVSLVRKPPASPLLIPRMTRPPVPCPGDHTQCSESCPKQAAQKNLLEEGLLKNSNASRSPQTHESGPLAGIQEREL